MKFRYYQEECIDAVFDFYDTVPIGEGDNPLVVLPTGAGKTPTILGIIDKILSEYPGENILIISHVSEILKQNKEALEEYFEGVPIGLYSAGLGERTINKITVAGIQSIHRKTDLFQKFGIIIIDEAHLIPEKKSSMYQTFLSKFDFQPFVIGLTATPYRLGQGLLTEGDNALFSEVLVDYSSFEKFNELVDEGYLSQVFSPTPDLEFDVTGIKITAGDFNEAELSNAFDREEITNRAVDEIIKFGKKFKTWLIFAIDIQHAEHVVSELNKKGIEACCIHSKLPPGEKDRLLNDYKDGKYRAAVNVNMLTTGINIPYIDFIVGLRPTQSPVFHAQSIGRGLRVVYADGYDLDTKEGRLAAIKASRKPYCLFLDFAGNTKRIGPINDVKIPNRKGKGKGDPITKTCPNQKCKLICHPSVKVCPACGEVFPIKEKIQAQADHNTEIVRKTQENSAPKILEVKVHSITYTHHHKTGKPTSLKVTYKTQLGQQFHDWVTIDHSGWARERALNWVRQRMNPSVGKQPTDLKTLSDAVMRLTQPVSITVDFRDPKFPKVMDVKFAETPAEAPIVFTGFDVFDDDDIPF